MDRSVAIRSGLLQALAVAVISVILAIALPRSFFEDWGWLAGPGAWFACALVTIRVLDLPPGPALLGAAVAGLPSLLAVLIGVHWLGAVLAVIVFGLWCGALAARGARPSAA